VPDGAMSIVNLAALPAADGGYLVEHDPLFHVLTAERDLLRDERDGQGRGLLTLADPDYGAVPGAGRRRATQRGVGFPDIRSMWFDPLPRTRKEQQGIVTMWARSHPREDGRARPVGGRSDVVSLRGESASEAAFKAEAPGKALIHVATHGFFVDNDPPGASISAYSDDVDDEVEPASNPLLRSGLAMAGANRSEESTASDGGGLGAAVGLRYGHWEDHVG
jgi:CHAT domain-containing protein